MMIADARVCLHTCVCVCVWLSSRYDTYMDEMRLVAHGALAYNARKGNKDL